MTNPITKMFLSLLLTAGILSFSNAAAAPHAVLSPLPRDNSGGAGTIEGRVVFTGKTIPQPTVIENVTGPASCGAEHSLEDILISKENRGLQNVILALANEGFPRKSRPQGEKLLLDNRKCRFDPHVAVLTSGSTVEAINSDAFFHTTHLYSGPLSRNLSLHVGGKASHPLQRPGFVIVKCDVHGWMKAFIRVDNHPFHAVSGADGKFQIRDIPEGSYTLEVWHEYYGEQKLAVSVQAGKTVSMEIAYPN